MPCDRITRMVVDAGKMPVDAVVRALAADGITATLSADRRYVSWPNHQYDSATGIVTAVRSSLSQDQEANYLKRSYAAQTVRDQARRFGWQIKEQPGGKFTIQKR